MSNLDERLKPLQAALRFLDAESELRASMSRRDEGFMAFERFRREHPEEYEQTEGTVREEWLTLRRAQLEVQGQFEAANTAYRRAERAFGKSCQFGAMRRTVMAIARDYQKQWAEWQGMLEKVVGARTAAEQEKEEEGVDSGS